MGCFQWIIPRWNAISAFSHSQLSVNPHGVVRPPCPFPDPCKLLAVPIVCLYCTGKTAAVTSVVQWSDQVLETSLYSNSHTKSYPQGVKNLSCSFFLWCTLSLGGGDFDVLRSPEHYAVSCLWCFNHLWIFPLSVSFSQELWKQHQSMLGYNQ